MKRSEEQLVRDFRDGDDKAGEELLTIYKNRVLATARRFFLADGDTEDLVQEGMCGLYSAMTTFTGETGFSAYAYTCIKNRMLDAVRKSCSNKNPPQFAFDDGEGADGMASQGLTPEEKLIDSESEREFSEAMKSALSPLEYTAIRLYVEGVTLPEIASSLGKTYKQTDNAIARAKKKLRTVINRGARG